MESSPPSKQFYAPLTKTKLKTFSSMQGKARKCKAGNKEVVLKADHRIFAHMILIAQSRQLNLKEVLCHPLGPLPWSLASPNGSMRTTNKSELAKQLLKFPGVVESLPSRSACVIDGMALVQKLNGDGRTFADLAEHALSTVLAEASHSTRVDVVFDVYHESSIKQLERLARGADSGMEVKQIAAGHRVQQWRKFLKNSNNKTNLAAFFLKEWGKDHCRARLNEKVLYTTTKGLCYKLTRQDVEQVASLSSTQEEADTRMFLHACHASRAGHKSVILVSDDTDVLVLSLANSHKLTYDLFLKTGTNNRTKYINISQLVSGLGSQLCKALPGFHAFTGCDSQCFCRSW